MSTAPSVLTSTSLTVPTNGRMSESARLGAPVGSSAQILSAFPGLPSRGNAPQVGGPSGGVFPGGAPPGGAPPVPVRPPPPPPQAAVAASTRAVTTHHAP